MLLELSGLSLLLLLPPEERKFFQLGCACRGSKRTVDTSRLHILMRAHSGAPAPSGVPVFWTRVRPARRHSLCPRHQSSPPRHPAAATQTRPHGREPQHPRATSNHVARRGGTDTQKHRTRDQHLLPRLAPRLCNRSPQSAVARFVAGRRRRHEERKTGRQPPPQRGGERAPFATARPPAAQG